MHTNKHTYARAASFTSLERQTIVHVRPGVADHVVQAARPSQESVTQQMYHAGALQPFAMHGS